MNQHNVTILSSLWPGLHGDDSLAMVRLSQRSLSS